MKMKSIAALLVALAFTFGMAAFTFAADVEGTVTKVEPKTITIKDAAGKETKVAVSNSSDVKVGDKAIVKEGKCVKEKAKRKSAMESNGY